MSDNPKLDLKEGGEMVKIVIAFDVDLLHFAFVSLAFQPELR